MKIIFLFVVLSICNTYGLTRVIKPKNFDQKQSASSYSYRSDHGPSQVYFVTGNGGGPQNSASFHSSSYSKPTEYHTDVDSRNGAHSYVIKHVTGNSYPDTNRHYKHETLPLSHAHASVEVDEPIHTSHEEIIEDHGPSSYDAGLDTGSVESSEGIVHGTFPAQYSHGTHHHGGHGDHESGFHKGYGEKYGQDYYKQHGDKGKKGYDKSHKETHGKKGHYDHADEDGHQEEQGGHTKKHYDEADKYGSNHEEGYKKKGGKHG